MLVRYYMYTWIGDIPVSLYEYQGLHTYRQDKIVNTN